MEFFSDKELSSDARIKEDISLDIYNEVLRIILNYNMPLSKEFPRSCHDNDSNIIGLDKEKFRNSLKALIPYYSKHLEYLSDQKNEYNLWGSEDEDKINDEKEIKNRNYALLDTIEFVYDKINDYSLGSYHDFFKHHHLIFKHTTKEKEKFRKEINLLFSRNGLIFELTKNGQIERILPLEISRLIQKTNYISDKDSNKLLNEALSNIVKPKSEDRQIAIEKLWDAFERIKTYYHQDGLDKRSSINKILKDVSCIDEVYDFLNSEAKELTTIGNKFRIRHHEQNKIKIDSKILDYLFYRMFSFISLICKNLS